MRGLPCFVSTATGISKMIANINLKLQKRWQQNNVAVLSPNHL